MIDITKLKKENIGKWVEYQSSAGEREKGKLKSWNDKYIFVVYKCGGNWNRFQDYTGVATNSKDLIFINKGEKMKGKIITIKLKPPITNYCPECGFTESNNYGSFVNCSECKAEMKRRHHPKIDFPTVSKDSVAKRYNFMGNEKSIQYYFHIPKKRSRGLTVDEKFAFDIYDMTPLEVAEELLRIYKEEYLMNTNDKKAKELIKELKLFSGYREKKKQYDIQVLKEKLYWLLKE